MIDTHSHIYGEEFSQDCDEVVARAFSAGVSHIFLPNINKGSIQPMLSLCDRYPGRFHPMMGLHPSDVDSSYREVLSYMESLFADTGHPYVAVGEVGLDFYWDTTYREQQLDAFRIQIEWAVRYQLPLVIHVRSAHRELLKVMADYSGDGLRGIFHCFGGSLQEARQLLSFEGFCLGIGGVLTFKKSTLPDVLAHVPLSRVVLETDAPYLAPVPYRGKRNESAFVVEVLRKMADVYGLSVKEVERVTDENAKRIFTRVI
ncbi:MAG: TatD family hydrolase [Bacteroidaceae bacterium]